MSMRLIEVDLPAPFGPRRATVDPIGIRRSTPARACVAPKRFAMPVKTTAGGVESWPDCAVVAMTLEHYPEMAEAEILRHVEDAARRWPLLGAVVIHRHGRLEPGEQIVLVVTASAHRQAAFAAAEFLMDYLKARAPFWKEVEYGASRRWVEAKASDDALAERWSKANDAPKAAE